jgi:class 3 adenylate cyclase/predicted ATPase
MKCPNCNFKNPELFKFCGECGTRLVELIPELPSSSQEQDISTSSIPTIQPVSAERRHITVMFCDLVGSTQLSEELDPEDFRQVLRVYQDTCSYVVNQFAGHLAQYLGDGVLIYFGYPRAHEDDSERAIRCALEILNEMGHLSGLQERYKGVNLAVRIGIHTGLVVVGELGGDKMYERLALGNTPNIAARLQALAEPNSIIISRVTYRLIKNYFACQSLGAYSLKGVSHKMEIFKVLSKIEAPSSFKTTVTTSVTPFVGRKDEVGKLLTSWKKVKKGRGDIALIIGEPGIGKTRLLQVFEEQIKNEPHTWLVCRCISYYQSSAFYPVINLLHTLLQFGPGDRPEEKLIKLEKGLSIYDFDLNEVVPILASLFSIPISRPYKSQNLTSQKQKEKTIEVLLDWLIKAAEKKPVLFVIEDLHWADPSTLEHLTLLMERIDRVKILIILTFHPRFHPPVSDKSNPTEILLERLARQQVELMVEDVTGGKSLPAKVIDLLLVKTDGIPLFVEEQTKMLLESDFLVENENAYELKGTLPGTAIPDTLQDTLMARLDRLGAEKEVVQLAAIIGREFSYDLIKAVTSLDEDTLKRELESLVESEILNREDQHQNTTYSFRQALIQDAAYNSLLKSTRQEHHRQIAKIIETQFKTLANTHPQIVAHHYSEAGDDDKAVEYHLLAGKLLVKQSAHREAIDQLKKGLHSIKKIDDINKRDALELDLQLTIGIPLLATKGYGADEVGKVYERASALSQKVGDVPQLFPAMVGLYRFYLLRGDITKAFDISELLLSWAQTSGQTPLILEANRAIGVTLFHMGEVATSLEHLNKGRNLFDPVQHRSHALLYGSDPNITCLSYGALALCLLGFAEQALAYGKEAIQYAKKIKHPFSLTFALNHHAWLHQFCKEADLVAKNATELLSVSSEYGFPFWQAAGSFFQGWVLAQKDHKKAGIEQMERSMKAFQDTGAHSVLPYFMSAVAEVYLENGQVRDSLKWLEEAEGAAKKNSEHFFDAEIYRLKAEATYASNRPNIKEVKSLLWRAIETARRQQLKILELRALMSLIRVSGRKEELMKLLKDTHNWFSEGLDTPDLQKAKNLLEQSV